MQIYGPVVSRRLGFSLGIDLFTTKTCTINCIYCQLGSKTPVYPKRDSFVSPELLENELRDRIESCDKIDYVTFSGQGEPTLSKDLGRYIHFIKDKFPDLKIAVLSNATLLSMPDVRNELELVDLFVPSLDAGTEKTFRKINRPHPKIKFSEYIDSLFSFRKTFKGEFRLEIMLVRGVNDSVEELRAIRKIIDRLAPDGIDINTPVRPPAEQDVLSPTDEILRRAKEILCADSIKPLSPKSNKAKSPDAELVDQIHSYLKRRPETLEGIASGLGIDDTRLQNELRKLLREGSVMKKIVGGKVFYTIP